MWRRNDANQDDMEGIARRLRIERDEISPLELDRIKTTVISRARTAGVGGRAGARRLAVAGLTVGLLAASTGGVLAGQGNTPSGNAAVAQYGNNCDTNNNHGNNNGDNNGGANNNENNNDNCNENSFNNTTVNNITNNGGSVTNNYTTVNSTPSAGVLGSTTGKVTTSARHIKIHVNVPRGAKLRRVTVKVNGKRVKTLAGKKASANVELVNLPCSKGATTIQVTVTLADGKTVTARHTYHLCTP